MKESEAVQEFVSGRRVMLAKFVAHRFKSVSNKVGKVVGVVNLYEVCCADGKAPTVQVWVSRVVQTCEQAAARFPCLFKEGQKVLVRFESMEPNTFDAKNGVLMRSDGVVAVE